MPAQVSPHVPVIHILFKYSLYHNTAHLRLNIFETSVEMTDSCLRKFIVLFISKTKPFIP